MASLNTTATQRLHYFYIYLPCPASWKWDWRSWKQTQSSRQFSFRPCGSCSRFLKSDRLNKLQQRSFHLAIFFSGIGTRGAGQGSLFLQKRSGRNAAAISHAFWPRAQSIVYDLLPSTCLRWKYQSCHPRLFSRPKSIFARDLTVLYLSPAAEICNANTIRFFFFYLFHWHRWEEQSNDTPKMHPAEPKCSQTRILMACQGYSTFYIRNFELQR